MKTVVELFGREVEVMESDEDDVCWKCALKDICQCLAEHLDTFTKQPCRKTDGTTDQWFKYTFISC